MERLTLTTPREKQDKVAKTIIDAATKAGGSGTKNLPSDNGVSVLVIVPAGRGTSLPQDAHGAGGSSPHSPRPTPAPSPNEAVRLEIVLSSPL